MLLILMMMRQPFRHNINTTIILVTIQPEFVNDLVNELVNELVNTYMIALLLMLVLLLVYAPQTSLSGVLTSSRFLWPPRSKIQKPKIQIPPKNQKSQIPNPKLKIQID